MSMTIDQAREIVNAMAEGHLCVSEEVVLQALCVCQRACMRDVSDAELQGHLQRLADQVEARVGHEGAR